LFKVAACWICCCLLSAAVSGGEREYRTLTLCYEDQDSYPWVMTDGSGLNLELLALVEQALQLRFNYVAVPWKRCLSGLEQGTYDGAFASSFKQDRLSMGHYPTDAEGRLDERKRLHTSRYALYRKVGSEFDWDGERFIQLTGRIGSLSGFSIVDLLRDKGAEVDETSRDPLAVLQMLRHGRIEAAALQSLRADFVLQGNAQLAVHLEKLPVPLEEKAYYLMLSNRLLAQEPLLAAGIWSEVERQRESAAYKQRVAEFLARSLP
jgi:polar amino acid transport system substrate-binding protein